MTEPDIPRIVVEILVTGRVQGVGFRAFTKRMAERHGLDGWVRNRPDGSVQALLRGAEDEIEAVLAILRRGPTGSRVDQLRTADPGQDALAIVAPERPGVRVLPTG